MISFLYCTVHNAFHYHC